VLEPIENHSRVGELVDPNAQLVVRGWPLTVDGLKRNALATSERYTYRGAPLVAVSAELTMPGFGLGQILAGRRLRTRSSYATVTARAVLAAGFGLLASFDAPHHSVMWGSYTDDEAERLLGVLGPAIDNPYYLRRLR
jgi:hypothetical protein